jgi:hypothetical protein
MLDKTFNIDQWTERVEFGPAAGLCGRQEKKA